MGTEQFQPTLESTLYEWGEEIFREHCLLFEKTRARNFLIKLYRNLATEECLQKIFQVEYEKYRVDDPARAHIWLSALSVLGLPLK